MRVVRTLPWLIICVAIGVALARNHAPSKQDMHKQTVIKKLDGIAQ